MTSFSTNKNFSKSGFSLVELMLVAAGLGGVALIVMQLGKNSLKIQNESLADGDYTQLSREVNFLISREKDCTASLSGKKFRGSTITSTPVTALELWSSDQSGSKSQKKFYEGQKYGKTSIETIGFKMPDYTAGVDFPEGSNQSFVGVLELKGMKKVLGNEKNFNPISQTLNVTFDTDSAGESTIKNCVVDGGTTASHSIDWY